MGQIAKFLLALERLARRQGLKIEDAYKFAKQEFGEITPLLKKQIQNVFDKIKKPVVGKPGKKEGTVLPLVRDAKKAEGIETLDDFNLSKDDPMGDFEKIVKGEGDTGLPKDPQSNVPEYDPEGRAQFEKDVKDAGGMEEFMDANPINPSRFTEQEIDAAIDNVSPGFSGDMKVDAELVADDLAQKRFDKEFYDLDQKQQMDIYDQAYQGLSKSRFEQKADIPPKLDSKENIMGAIDKLKNPKRPGGSLDPAIGITRALARRILDKKGIEIGKKDPIDVFTDTFGEAISDVNNLAEEMIEIDARGGGMKDMDQMLEIEGLFDIEIPTNPQKGLTDDEMIEMLEKDLKEKETLEDFDPTFRKPNATGGLTRTSYAMGKGPVLPSDEDPINPFGPKPTGPVLPDKSMIASYGYDDAMGESFAEFLRLKKIGEIPMDMEFDEYLDQLDIDIPYGKKQKQAPSIKLASSRVQAASGGLADILKV